MVEQLPFKQLVWSSSLQRPTKKKLRVSKLAVFLFCGNELLRERRCKIKTCPLFF